MPERAPNVLGIMAAPDRETSLRAISLALLRIRSSGISYEKIGKAIGCCADTVENAANEKSTSSR